MNLSVTFVPALLLVNTILFAADSHPNGDVFSGGTAPASSVAGQVQIGAGQVAIGNRLGIGAVTPIRPLHIGDAGGGEMILEKTAALADYRKWNFFTAGPANDKSALLLRQLNDAGSGGAIVTTWDGAGMMSVYGGAPLGIDVGRVAIGGGRIWANDLRVQDVIGIGPVTPIRQLHFGNSSGAEMVMEKTSALANYRKWNFFVAGPTNDKSALLLRQLNDAGSGGAIATTWDGAGMMSIYGAAPGSVEAGRVAIGGGKIAANEVRVNGLITAKEVRVSLSVWADSVFSTSYRLPSLSEVSAAILRDGHLPGLPSEKEVIAEGILIGDMSRLHMSKIEELTLYAIDADLRLQSAQHDIVTLTEQRDAMAIRLAKLEAAVDRLSQSTKE